MEEESESSRSSNSNSNEEDDTKSRGRDDVQAMWMVVAAKNTELATAAAERQSDAKEAVPEGKGDNPKGREKKDEKSKEKEKKKGKNRKERLWGRRVPRLKEQGGPGRVSTKDGLLQALQGAHFDDLQVFCICCLSFFGCLHPRFLRRLPRFPRSGGPLAYMFQGWSYVFHVLRVLEYALAQWDVALGRREKNNQVCRKADANCEKDAAVASLLP